MNLRTNTNALIRVLFLTSALVASTSCWCAQEVLVATKHDEYTKSTGIATQNHVLPNNDIGSSFFHPTSAYATLLGNVTDAGQESMSLRLVYTDFSGWAFLSTAHDSDGTALPVVVINREVESGSRVSEEISISLSRAYLSNHAESGIDIRVDGKKGQVFVKMPSTHVTAFVKQLEVTEADVRTKLSAPILAAAGKAKLGVGFLPVDATNAKFVGLTSPKGALVAHIAPGSLASKAGFAVGDVILSANGTPVAGTLTGLPELVASFPAGALVDFTIWRANAEAHLSVQF